MHVVQAIYLEKLSINIPMHLNGTCSTGAMWLTNIKNIGWRHCPTVQKQQQQQINKCNFTFWGVFKNKSKTLKYLQLMYIN